MDEGEKTRFETDSFGPIEVAADRYWGAQTQRSCIHFAIGAETMPIAIIRALAVVKRIARRGQSRPRTPLPAPLCDASVATASEVESGRLDAEFPLLVWQTGSGAQTNMNVNEVIANRANELLGAPRGAKHPIHPNDDVNLSQSSNDSFPTAMHIAAVLEIKRSFEPALRALHLALRLKSEAFASIIKVGRTHLQDATPVTLGQEFSGYAAQAEHGMERLEATLPGLYRLAKAARRSAPASIPKEASPKLSRQGSPP